MAAAMAPITDLPMAPIMGLPMTPIMGLLMALGFDSGCCEVERHRNAVMDDVIG